MTQTYIKPDFKFNLFKSDLNIQKSCYGNLYGFKSKK